MKAKLEQLFKKIEEMKEMVKTEEATKTAFIMPFIQLLGYDIFNPMEVVPEFIADIGTKKGEKADYVIMQDGKPAMIIECKHWESNPEAHNSQLHRYYHVSKARFGVMTNGIIYNFFADMEQPNIMDDRPFLTVDLANIKETTAKELEKFTKQSFDIDNILSSAETLKYIKSIKLEFDNELKDPSDEFVKMIVRRFYDKQITANRLEAFREYFKKAITSYMNEIINARLKSALNINEKEEEEGKENQPEIEESPKIVTTEEELEGFQIVKAILREKLSSERIAYRDTQSYFGILLDDNNRKPLVRLHFNSSNKYIELFDAGKDNSEKVLISSLDDIYNLKERLLKTVENYE